MTQLNNRYQILESLARGGFGETFLAIDTHLPSSRKCVIKQLKPAIESPVIPDWLIERFQREAAILEDLGENNPQIPRLYAYFQENNNFYLVQEWIEGLTLTQYQEQKGNLSPSQVTEILAKILPILAYIHSRRIIHRDIKPDNIIIRSQDQLPILIDFGIMKEAIATYVDPNGRTAYSVALGTPGYMASEQAAGRPVYSSDLYSLGLTVIFLLTGKSPQYLDHDNQTGEIIWRNLVPNCPDSLAKVINKSVRFHPRDRFVSAREMLSTLTVTPTKVPVAATTAATQVISPQISQTSVISSPSQWEEDDSEEEKTPAWLTWLVLPLSVAAVVFGAFLVGFNLLSNQEPRSAPSESVEPPPTQTFPTPETPKPTPTPEYTPTPTPTPKPVNKPTPIPTAAPTPQPEPEITPLYPEPIIPPGAELTPLVPIPEDSPASEEDIMPNPLVPSSSPQSEAIPIPVIPPPEEN